MRTYTYTAFDGHPDYGGRAIPPMTSRRVKALDSYTALAKAQAFTEDYIKTSCDYVGERRYYVLVFREGVRLDIGFLTIEKDGGRRQRAR